MLHRDEALEVVARAVEASTADETEALWMASDGALTRYAGNAITQNTSARSAGLTVRAIVGTRVGRASGNRIDRESLNRTVERAIEAARAAHEDPDVAHPIDPPERYTPVDALDPEAARLSPQARADAIAHVCERARDAKMEASGSFSNGTTAIALANSRGVRAFHAASRAEFNATAASADASGWACGEGYSLSKIDPRAIGSTAVDKALAGRNPRPIEPGSYTVILEPAAVTEFLLFLARSFGAKVVAEGRSFLTGRMGRQVLGDNITIVDDPYHPDSNGMPFDFEGAPKQRTVLIDKGVAVGLAYDSKTAAAAGRTSTGHALPQPNSEGPMPLNLVLAGGETTLEEMIASTDRGILVTHFHYTNVIDPIRVVLTGMTRDGTFLVEGGKVKHAVRNLRFTQSAVEALQRVEALSRETIFASAFFGGGFVVPAMKIGRFAFSSATEF